MFAQLLQEGERGMRSYAYAVIKGKKTLLWLNGKRSFQYILYTWSTNIIVAVKEQEKDSNHITFSEKCVDWDVNATFKCHQSLH